MFNVAVGSPKPPKGNRITDGTLFIPSVSGKSYTNKQCLIIKIMNILKASMGKDYPKFETAIYADGNTTIVTVSRTLSPNHVDLDSPSYIENKLKKRIQILKEIGITKNQETGEQSINVTVEVGSAFNGITHLNHLVGIATAISEIAEDRLSEPEAIKNIGLDCKPFICTDDEPEEAQADA